MLVILLPMTIVSPTYALKPSAATWSRTYGLGDDMFSSGQQTLDGGYIFAGSSISSASQIYAWLVKLNSTGGIQWQHKYAEPGWTEADSVRQTSDGGFIVAGKAPINDVTTA